MESMESSTVAALVKYFNAALIVAVAFFAICGVIMIIRRKVLRVDASGGRAEKRRKGAVKGGYTLLFAFCAAAIAAFAAEATFFNYQHYLKIFAGRELQTLDISPENPNVIMTTSGAPAEILTEKDENTKTSSVGVVFKNLNMSVTSIFVDVGFGGIETMEITVQWIDDVGTHSFKKKLNEHLPHDNYSPIQPCGKVSELKVMFTASSSKNDIEITTIALNKQIPFYFSGLRLIVTSFLFFVIICLFKKEPRAKAAYWLFEYKFDPADLKQNLIHALLVVLLILFSYLCVNTSYPKSYFDYPVHRQYNEYLVDALANGRTWLDFGTPENLLKAERPYDNAYRIANGYKFNSDVMWDWTWYKGKFYCYYGVVPAAILYLPYKLVTGKYLSNNGGIFVFSAVIIILTAMLWRFCVKKYMPNAGFVFYTLSFLTLFFASGIFAELRYNRFYSIVQTAGLMFALAGCLLLLKSVENEKVNRLKLFFACICMALVAGCRPNMIFVSLLVPFVLWRYKSWKLLPFVIIPYVIVAVPLCAYNYARFDSIFEFGVKYTLTGWDSSSINRLNIFGKIVKTFWSFVSFLFTSNKYSLYFPFVECYPPPQDAILQGLFNPVQPGSGMINFPIVFCLPYLFKNILDKRQATDTKIPRGEMQRISWMFIIIAASIAAADSFVVGFSGRFLLDFAVFMILPSLFCAYCWCAGSDGTHQNKNRVSVVHVLLAASVIVGLFLCVSGTFVTGVGGQVHYDPVLYRYLEYSLGILRNV